MDPMFELEQTAVALAESGMLMVVVERPAHLVRGVVVREADMSTVPVVRVVYVNEGLSLR